MSRTNKGCLYYTSTFFGYSADSFWRRSISHFYHFHGDDLARGVAYSHEGSLFDFNVISRLC